MRGGKVKDFNSINGSKMNGAIIDFLSKLSLFCTLQADELKIVAEHMHFLEIEKDEILFREGDKGEYICFVLNGIIDIVKESPSGDGVVIASLLRGRSIGEMSVIDSSPRSATAKAQTKSSLLILEKRGFDKILYRHPEIGITILKGITKLLSLNLRKTSSRLAEYLFPIS
jgi:CRP-like cAMP-binding protein